MNSNEQWFYFFHLTKEFCQKKINSASEFSRHTKSALLGSRFNRIYWNWVGLWYLTKMIDVLRKQKILSYN